MTASTYTLREVAEKFNAIRTKWGSRYPRALTIPYIDPEAFDTLAPDELSEMSAEDFRNTVNESTHGRSPFWQ